MKDNWLNKLIVAVVLFVSVILIGLFTMRKPNLKYELSEQQTLAAILKPGEQISPGEANQLIQAKNPAFLFVDLRNADEFIKGHPEGAVNIPINKLLSKENLELLKQDEKDNKTIIFYGVDQLQVTSPWLLLKQLGFEKVKVLQGGYSKFAGNQAVLADSLTKQTSDAEAAHYNFADMVQTKSNTGKEVTTNASPQKVTIKPKPKSSAPAAGGC